MEWIALVTLLVAAEMFIFAILVGKARMETGVEAPAVIGDPKFERYLRVQQNTIEQLVIFYPSLWVFGYYISTSIGAALGVVFIIGRIIYFRGYVEDPAKRGVGFIIGSLAMLTLLLGGIIGLVLKLL